MLEEQQAHAQQALDELFAERLLAFKLSARMVGKIGVEEYKVYFHESRLHSVDISWYPGNKCFKDVFRSAVLESVRRLSGLSNGANPPRA